MRIEGTGRSPSTPPSQPERSLTSRPVAARERRAESEASERSPQEIPKPSGRTPVLVSTREEADAMARRVGAQIRRAPVRAVESQAAGLSESVVESLLGELRA